MHRSGARNIRVAFSAGQLTHFGGVYLLHRFLQQLQVRTFLGRQLYRTERNNHFSITERVFALTYPMILGLDRIELSGLLGTNGVFQYITGLPRFPRPNTLRRFLIERAPVLLPKLQRAHDQLRTIFLQRPATPSSFWIDCDSTVRTLYGHQEGAAVGYNPQHRGKRSYHPLLLTEAHRGDTLAGLLRSGDAYTADRIEELTDQTLTLLPHRQRLRLRADAGFYEGKFVAQLRRNRIQFAIVAKMTAPVKALVPGKRYRHIRSDLAVTEFHYRPHGWDRAERFVVLRRRLPLESEDPQRTLFTFDRYAYHVLVTDLDLTPYEAFRFYRDRSKIERIIRTLKDDYPFGSAPTNHFVANALYAECSLLAYNLIVWFKRLCLPEDWQPYTIAELRRRLLFMPGVFTRTDNRPTLRLPTNSPYQDVVHDALRRIGTLAPIP